MNKENPTLSQLRKAAPDMYEALKSMAACFRNIEILSNTTDEFEKGMLKIAIDTMTKVLAKAEGKEEK